MNLVLSKDACTAFKKVLVHLGYDTLKTNTDVL